MRHPKRNRNRNQRTKPQQNALRLSPLTVGNQSTRGNRSVQMAAAVAHSFNQEKLYVSRASIQLQLPPSEGIPRIYEWRTQVAPPNPAQEEEQQQVCIKKQTTEAATPRGNYYTPPQIFGTEAKRKNLPQTLSNFFEAERHSSAWNRVTK